MQPIETRILYKDMTRDDNGEAALKTGTLDSLVYRAAIVRKTRGGGVGCVSYLVFESLPEEYQNGYINKYGDSREVPVKEPLKLDLEAQRFFHTAFKYRSNGVLMPLEED